MTQPDRQRAALAAGADCQHDGSCSGRLALADGARAVKISVVCDDCGTTVGVLGQLAYTLAAK